MQRLDLRLLFPPGLVEGRGGTAESVMGCEPPQGLGGDIASLEAG
jgi:hypothetical protein